MRNYLVTGSILFTLLLSIAASQAVPPAYGPTSLPDLICYVTEPHLPNAPQVTVDDQFIPPTPVDPENRGALCMPMGKGFLPPPAPHFTTYRIVDGPDPFVKFDFTDQFGTDNLDVREMKFLWTGALKNQQGEPPDIHFTEYRVEPQVKTVTVNAFDQFHPDGRLLSGTLFAILTPALKNQQGEPPSIPHYKCYILEEVVNIQNVLIIDQFDRVGTLSNLVLVDFFCLIADKTPKAVGGEILPIDTTALFIAGAFTNTYWILPVLGGIAGTVIAVIRTRSKRER